MKIGDVIKKYIDDEYSFSLGHKMFNIPCEEIEENEIEQFILLRDIATIHLSIDISCFEIVPMWKPVEGKSTFSIEDVDNGILNSIKDIDINELPIALQIKVLEIIHYYEKSKNSFDMLISKYYLYCNREINAENWTGIKDGMIRGAMLCRLTKNNEKLSEFSKILENHNLELSKQKLVIPLIQFAKIQYFMFCEDINAIKHLDSILCIETTENNVFYKEDAYKVKYEILQDLKNDEKLLELCIEICEFILRISNQFDKNNIQSNIVASAIDAFFISIVECANKNKDSIIQSKLNEIIKLKNYYSKNIISNTTPFYYEINYKQINDFLDRNFSSLNQNELIGLIAIYTYFFHENRIKNITIEKLKKSSLDCFWGKKLVERHTGLITCQIKPLDVKNIEESESFDMYVHQEFLYLAGKLGMHITEPILKFISSKYHYTIEDLNCFVKDNVIIPEGKETIFAKGLAYFLNGDYEIAAYILVPQLEHLFRMLIKMNGGSIIKPSIDNNYYADKFQTLTEIFNNQVLKDLIEDYVLYDFQVFLDLKSGFNIRNLLCHGLLYSEEANSPTTVYFLAMILKWIFLSSKTGQQLLYNNKLLKSPISLPKGIFEEVPVTKIL